MRSVCAATVAFVLVAVLLSPAGGVINPGLQPVDLCQRHQNVLICHVTGVDVHAGTFSLKVANSLKGDMKAGDGIVVAAEGDMKALLTARAKDGSLAAGRPLVAFAGKTQPRSRQKDLLFYCDGGWGVGQADEAARWTWKATDAAEEAIAVGADAAGAVSTLGGTWNGSTAMLQALVMDIFAGSAYLPRKAYVAFQEELPLMDMAGAGRGVALYDIDGDGKLDIYACGDAGDQLMLQSAPQAQPDGTMPPVGFVAGGEYMGLAGLASPSCSLADVNGDGLADLLAGAVIYVAADRLKERFGKSDLLAAAASLKVKSAAFVELNGDGWPDVVISCEQGGLRAFLNPGDGGAFADVTTRMGLDRKACGAGLTGFFDAGDWDGDGRADLFYGAAGGLLLVQDAKGVFAPLKHDAALAFESGPQRSPGLTGAACFATILGHERLDVLAPMESAWAVLANEGKTARDVTAGGGEISEASFGMIGAIAEDFNLDGYMDFYTVARGDAGQNRLLLGRGYGTFMHADPHRYYGPVFPSAIGEAGGWGSAAGDVDGDGSSDLVVTNGRGEAVLVLNNTLSLRACKDAHPIDDLKVLSGAGVLAVDVRGRGTLGATVSVLSADNKCIGRRYIGSNISTGCRGPDRATFAIRKAGDCTVQVRYADGHVVKAAAQLPAGGVKKLAVSRSGATSLPASGPATAPATMPATAPAAQP